MPPPPIGGGGIMFSGRLFGRPLTHISRDAISLLLNGGISIKLATYTHHMSGIGVKVFKVKGQRSKS